MLACCCASPDCRMHGCRRAKEPPIVYRTGGAWPHMTRPKDVPKDVREHALQQRIEALENALWALIEAPLTPASAAAEAKTYMLNKEGRD